MLQHPGSDRMREDLSGNSLPLRPELFSERFQEALKESYYGLRAVALNWAQTAAQDLEEVRAVLVNPMLARSVLEQDSVGFTAVSAERISKLLIAVVTLSRLLDSAGMTNTTREEYDSNVRDPLGHIKVLASDRLVSDSGSMFSPDGGSTRDVSLRSLVIIHGEEIDRLIHTIQ
jgi:hypothetical protein